jgi:hypothetical protein
MGRIARHIHGMYLRIIAALRKARSTKGFAPYRAKNAIYKADMPRLSLLAVCGHNMVNEKPRSQTRLYGVFPGGKIRVKYAQSACFM